MNKYVVIINGIGSVGKDTLCNLASKHFKTRNISSITPVKDIAYKHCGWNGSKDKKSRKFLSDLKQLLIDYNDLPFQYIKDEYNNFLNSKDEILFIHIREINEIEKVKNYIGNNCVTLLIIRNDCEIKSWGNQSDDNVNEYNYDYIFKNDDKLEIAEMKFCSIIEEILRRCD